MPSDAAKALLTAHRASVTQWFYLHLFRSIREIPPGVCALSHVTLGSEESDNLESQRAQEGGGGKRQHPRDHDPLRDSPTHRRHASGGTDADDRASDGMR